MHVVQPMSAATPAVRGSPSVRRAYPLSGEQPLCTRDTLRPPSHAVEHPYPPPKATDPLHEAAQPTFEASFQSGKLRSRLSTLGRRILELPPGF